ncbi:phosphoribosylglycinamide formyltransferase [candidate division WOR-3 bacterium]|nr:phosphoribosylglycinamide formyltransferase [candidate division WOR-3 bacterium]
MNTVGIGVLASGRGSNFEALARAEQEGRLKGEVRLLVVNVAGAGALERARALGVPARVINHREFGTRVAFEQALVRELEAAGVELVCLAGFMRILSPFFVSQFRNRVLNVHPSLLPAFAGLLGMQVHEAVLAAGVKFSGCTVHFVSEDVDAGPIVVQRVVPVLDSDSAGSLAERVLAEEHQAYVEAVRLYCERRLEVSGRRVRVV